MPENSTRRFSNRVDDYVKYRPGYPAAVVSYLEERYNLSPGQTIADIGSGTGITTALFLDAGYPVLAVEPNLEMRERSVELLGARNGFSAVDGTAEATTLPAASVDAIIAGQAFHWFDREKAKAEFKRILRPNGIVALLWNERLTGSPFEKEYDELIVRHGNDYVKVDHRQIDADSIGKFFHPRPYELVQFPNYQVFDLEGLLGRLLSSSYMPVKTDPAYPAMESDLMALFGKYQENGLIRINYTTKMYIGRI